MAEGATGGVRPGGEGGGGKPTPSINYELINGNLPQSFCNIWNGVFEILNGTWIQNSNYLTDSYGIESTGSHLMDIAYVIWLDNGLNNIYQLDEFGDVIFDEDGNGVIIGQNDFELINGNCWQSIFIWSGLKDWADTEAILGNSGFGDYPYNGSWEFTVVQLLASQNRGFNIQSTGLEEK